MSELGNTPADKDYKPRGIVNDLAEGQIKAVQLLNGTYITEKLAKSMTKAEQRALEAYPVEICGYTVECRVGAKPEPQDWNEERRKCFQEGYEAAEKDISAIVKEYLEKGFRCMEQSDESQIHAFWDGFHNCAENILRELEAKK